MVDRRVISTMGTVLNEATIQEFKTTLKKKYDPTNFFSLNQNIKHRTQSYQKYPE